MTGAPTTVAIAAALALVLQFAMLREQPRVDTLNLLRLHVTATAIAAAASALSVSAGPARSGVLLAGALLLAGLGLRVRGTVRRIDARTGGTRNAPASGAMWSVPSIAAGLALTALAVLCIGALAPAAAAAAGRQGMAFGLASALLALLSASRPGPPAPTLARLVVVGDGLVLLACAVRAPAGLTAAVLLLSPAMLLVAAATLGRAGGLPVADEGGWR